MKKIVKYISIFLLAIMTVTLFTACRAEEEEVYSKKAIISIPGLMGSNLMDEENGGEAFWSFSNLGKLLMDIDNTIIRAQEIMSIDENGVPENYVRPANMSDEKDKYSLNNMLKRYCEYLVPAYGDEYEIVVWQYDWRESNLVSAGKLEQFINGRGYTEVVLMTHSMGGNVVAKYLTKAENRAKVKLFVPHAAPFFGSFDVYGFIFKDLAENSGSEFMNNLMSGLLSLINIDEVSKNMAPIFELSPYAQFSKSDIFADGETAICIDGQYVDVETEIELIQSLDYAKKTNGELKPAIANILSFQQADFILVDGEYKHVTDLVPTEFVVSTGLSTRVGVEIDSAQNGVTKYKYSNLGDGTVPVYSATAGRGLNDPSVHYMEGYIHGYVMESEISLEILKEILPTYIGEPNVAE